MTREEILSATPEWLNLKTLEILGIELVGTESDEGKIRIGEAILAKEHLAYRNIDKELCITNGGVWNPAEDIRDAYQLEEKVKEMGIQGKYCDELDTICCQMEGLKFDFWNCIHATPEQRTKAFLLATEPGN
jgi:hypothetical protein